MNIHFFSTLGVAVLGSYFSFFRPALLSNNIKSLKSNLRKWLWSAGTSIVQILFYYFLLQQKKVLPISYYILCWLLFIGIIDSYSRVIPNRLLYAGIAGWFVLLFIGEQIIAAIVPAVAGGLLLAGLRLASEKIWGRPGFGWGDIKLIFVLGLLIGWNIFFVLYVAILSGGIFSVLGILLKKLDATSKLSFAPHIVMGFLLIEIFDFFASFLSLIG